MPQFDHVVVVVFENKAQNRVLGSDDAPTFARLANSYATLLNYRAITRPSLPNYLALVSGSTQGITDDCTRCVVDAPNLVDTLEAAGRTWKAYAEGLPAPGFNGDGKDRYAKRHVPFLYFRDILTKPSRRRRIVPFGVFGRDLARRRLPAFSFVVPDLCNDMHDCPVAIGDAWLGRFIRPLLASPEMERGVVFVLFDESDDNSADAGGVVPAFVAGPLVRVGVRSKALLDHYSLLRTIEDGLRLSRLGLSATARPITGVWRATR